MSDQYYSEFERFLDGGSARKPTIPRGSSGLWNSESTAALHNDSSSYTQDNLAAGVSRSYFDGCLSVPPPFYSAPQEQFSWEALTNSAVEPRVPFDDNFSVPTSVGTEKGWVDSRYGSPLSSNSSESPKTGAVDVPAMSRLTNTTNHYTNSAPPDARAGSLIVPRNAQAYNSRPTSSSSLQLVGAIPTAQDFFQHQSTEVFKRLSIDDRGDADAMFAFAVSPSAVQSPRIITDRPRNDIWSPRFVSASTHPYSMIRGSHLSSANEALPPHHHRSSSQPTLNQRNGFAVPPHMFVSRSPSRPASQNSQSSAQSWPTNPQTFVSLPQGPQGTSTNPPREKYGHASIDQPHIASDFFYQPFQPQADIGIMTQGSVSVASPEYWETQQDERVALLRSLPHSYNERSQPVIMLGSSHSDSLATSSLAPTPSIADGDARPTTTDTESSRLKIVQYDSYGVLPFDLNSPNPVSRNRINPGRSHSSSRHSPGTFTFVGGPSRKAALLSMAADPTRGTKRASPDAADDSTKTAKRKARAKSDVGGAESVFQTYTTSGAPASSPMGLTSAFTSMFSHLHIINIPCPHPDCSFTAAADDGSERNLQNLQQGRKKGRAPKPYSCPYLNPVNGGTCQSAFRRRGCRDRHGGSHAGKESKDVSNNILSMSLARRLLWETCRIVETADWGCLYLDNQIDSAGQVERVKSQIASGEISSHQAAASVFVSRDEARRRIEVEYDVNALREQAEGVRKALLDQGELEVARSPQGLPPPGFAIRPIDLSLFPLFKRMAMKRAATYERYFCPEKNCEVDFTRLDALLRHSKNSHGAGGKKIRGGSGRSRQTASGVGASKHKSNKRKKQEEDSDDETEEDEEDEWGSKKGGTSEPESEEDER